MYKTKKKKNTMFVNKMQPEGQKQKDMVICEYFVTSQINRQKSEENGVIHKKENL